MLDLSTLPQGRPTGGQSPSHAEVASASSLVLPVLGGQETRSIPARNPDRHRFGMLIGIVRNPQFINCTRYKVS